MEESVLLVLGPPPDGRGGTSLIPPFQWVSENVLQKGQSLDALVYFTDGYGSFPKKEPGFSTLWLVPKNGFQSPPFGELIRIG
jgi:predicted metal-dependent peptidase